MGMRDPGRSTFTDFWQRVSGGVHAPIPISRMPNLRKTERQSGEETYKTYPWSSRCAAEEPFIQSDQTLSPSSYLVMSPLEETWIESERFAEPKEFVTAPEPPGLIPHMQHERKERLHPFARATTTICAFAVGASAALYESRGLHLRVNHCEHSRFQYSVIRPTIEEDPALQDHVVMSIVYTIATTTVYHLNRRHCQQSLFVLCGIAIGGFFGMIRHKDLQDTMMKVMPWTILASLLSSQVMHGILR